MTVLVDSNVLIDILTEDSHWTTWSADQLERIVDEGGEVAINPIIYAEIAVGFTSREELEEALGPTELQRLPLPWDGALHAAQAYEQYRHRGGTRTSPLPDFYIGGHALVEGLRLLTRDVNRYKTYFPEVELIHPPDSMTRQQTF